MNGKNALVTGATGFIGSRVVERLLADGWTVHAIVRPESHCDRIRRQGAELKVFTPGAGIELLSRIVRDARPEVVFHLASHFVSDHATKDVPRLLESNLWFGAMLLEAMRCEGVMRLVNTSTGWQHYEGRRYSPVNLYAATKQAFESLLQYYVEACEFRAITLELFDTYGPDDPRRKILSLLLDAARSGRELAVSPGHQPIDLVHVQDVAAAYSHAAQMVLTQSSQSHLHFCISSGGPMTLRELVAELGRVLNENIPVRWGGRAYRQREVMQATPFYPVLPDWSPKISLREGLKTLR